MDLEPRVTALEKDMVGVKAEQAHFRLHCATKEDLLSAKLELKEDIHTSTWRIIGFNIGFSTLTVSAVYFIANAAH
jgi:hypothetical protein